MEPATAGPLGHSAVCQLINDKILTATVVEGGDKQFSLIVLPPASISALEPKGR